MRKAEKKAFMEGNDYLFHFPYPSTFVPWFANLLARPQGYKMKNNKGIASKLDHFLLVVQEPSNISEHISDELLLAS